MIKTLQKIALQRAINHAKFAHYVPGKTKAPVPFVRNHDYIGGTFYHGPMDRWKSVSEYREKAEAPVEAWRKDPEEKKKHKERQKSRKKKKKKKHISKRAERADRDRND